MKNIKKIFIMANIMVLSFTALAKAEAPIPMGWYLEGNLGGSKISDVSYAPNTSISTTGLAWSLNGGYKFIPYFAAEIGYTSYANGKINFNGSQVGKDQAQSYDIAAKAIMPVQDTGAELFAKLGVARAKSQITATNAELLAASGETLNTGKKYSTNLYFGMGGDYAFMPNTAINLQWNRVDGASNTGNLDLFSLGLTYLFD
ncbi:MAG: hypothetical protein K0S27_1197 [Gammaproteobacteria bacterium]|nr:hypothetical protein [Gammaproteobacteria bacterium]